jgi:2-(1,2-epoxy-1,2-dihydrophenyl)acetyl-CoA isomerase
VNAPDEPVLLSDDRDGIRTLTLNRPHRKNAIDALLWRQLADALRATARDDGVRALVITGAGGAFCSGSDIGTGEDIHPRHKLRRLSDVALALHDLAVPTVAKVTGVAVGAGWNLALGCDFVVATPESRFCQIFAKRGLSVDLGGSWLLPKLVGLQQAKRLVLLADMIDAAEAHRLGLVTWVTPADEIDAFVDDLARRLAAGPAGRIGAEQGAAQRRRQRHFRPGGGQRGPRTAGELRHGRLGGGVRGVRGQAGAGVHWAMGGAASQGAGASRPVMNEEKNRDHYA